MRKHYFLFSILVLSISLSLPQTLRAQAPPCMPNSNITPSTYVPFSSIYYISAPGTATTDMLVVGWMSYANYQGLSGVPLPNAANQQFCNPITLAPGIVANAYVPSAQELLGNFGTAFSSVLFNPESSEICAAWSNGAITSCLPSSSFDPGLFAWRIPATQPGPTVYVSTYEWGQILAVDGSSGVTSVVYNPGESYWYDLEGLAVGPDSNIYATDPIDGDILQISPTGSSLQVVYAYSECQPGVCTYEPQGPSFSTTGQLTFNTEDDKGVLQINLSSCSQFPCTATQMIGSAAVSGQGTTFNLSDELLIVDQKNNIVLQQNGVGASTASTLISNTYLDSPVGVAVNSSGYIFVANLNNSPASLSFYPPGYIAQFDSTGQYVNQYVTFSRFSGWGADAPFFMQFDASGRLYVVTATDGYYDSGRVWRVDPCGSPPCTATLLVDLSYAYLNGTVPNLHGTSGAGVAVAGTGTSNSYTTPPVPIPSTCQADGCTITTSYGTVATSSYTFVPGTNFGDATTASIAVNFQLWNPTVFDTNRFTNMTTNTWSGGTPVPAGTTCIPIAGTGGNCIVMEALCYASDGTPILPCQISAPLGSVIGLASTYQTQASQPYCGLIIADDGKNNWANVTTSCSANDPTIMGGTNSLNTDTAIVNLNLSGTAPTVTFSGVPTSGTAAYQSTLDVMATTTASTTPAITATAGSVCSLGTPSTAASSTTVAVTMTSGTGTCNLTAFSPADTTYAAAYATQPITATKIAPMATFTGAPSSEAYQGTFPVTAATNASTTASITASGVCSLGTPSTTTSSTGTSTTVTVTMTSGSGPCNLTANWAADNNYVAASANQSTNASPASQTITVTPPGPPGTANYGSTFNVAATASSGLAVAITTSGGCSGSGSASATITMTSGTTTCTVNFNQLGNTNYSAAPTVSSPTSALKIASTVNITSNAPNPSAPGQPVLVSFSVTGNGSPTGTVTVTASSGETPCTGTLSAGAGSCSLTFFTDGSRTLTATYSGDPNFNGSTSTTVTQTVNGPLASVSPQSINFGTVYLGTITVKSVTVTNVGNAAMTISDPFIWILSGGDSKEFVAVNLCPKSLAAGKSCTMEVAFLAGPYYTLQTATLNVVDNAYNTPQTVPLSATVINPQAWLSAWSLSFGTVKVGKPSAAKAVTLKNTGATPLTITSMAIAGTDPQDFLLQGNTCPLAPASLAAGGSCTFNVTFEPTAKGLRSASVVITDNALNSPQNISLSGKGD